MQKKHPDVTTKGKTVDMSDILNDPLITLHTKYSYSPQSPLFFSINEKYVEGLSISENFLKFFFIDTSYISNSYCVSFSLH